jgi:hypothetical protein
MKLENALSPMIRNRSILVNTLEPDDIDLIRKIKELKMDVVNERIDPEKMKLLRPEIVDSWIRSYNYGLNVFDYNFAPTLERMRLICAVRRKPCSLKLRSLLSNSWKACWVIHNASFCSAMKKAPC